MRSISGYESDISLRIWYLCEAPKDIVNAFKNRWNRGSEYIIDDRQMVAVLDNLQKLEDYLPEKAIKINDVYAISDMYMTAYLFEWR